MNHGVVQYDSVLPDWLGWVLLAVLVGVAVVFIAMAVSVNPVVPHSDSVLPNHGVPQYYSPVLPHCHASCMLGDQGVHSA